MNELVIKELTNEHREWLYSNNIIWNGIDVIILCLNIKVLSILY